jgi:hypothetical protein
MRCNHGWKYNIKMDIIERECEGLDGVDWLRIGTSGELL